MAELGTLPSWTEPGHYAAGLSGVTLSEARVAAAWNVQGNFESAPFADTVRRRFGIALPAAPHSTARSETLTALWLGPRSRLLVTGDPAALTDFDAGRDAVNGAGGALFDVSASSHRVDALGSTGGGSACPRLPARLPSARLRRRRLRTEPVRSRRCLIVKHDEAPTFTLLVARSYARDAWHSLLTAAAQYGVDIGAATPYR